MCFSTEASFGASAILATIGITTLSKVKSKKNYLFASIPLIFGAQQFSEGLIWLSFSNPNYFGYRQISTYYFLTFAQVLWPLIVPLCLLIIENRRAEKIILILLTIMGLTVATYHFFCLILYPVSVEIIKHHIYYKLDFSAKFRCFEKILYLTPILFSFFVPSERKMKLIGILIFFSFLTSIIFFKDNIISVWCFFAALVSIVVYSIINNQYIK